MGIRPSHLPTLSRDLGAEYDALIDQGTLFRIRAYAQDNPIQTKGDTEDEGVKFGGALGAAMVRQGPGTFKATCPHDYLYGMIGLSGGGELLPPKLAPDHEKPFPKVCEDYARCIIKAAGSVAILGRQFCNLYADYDTVEKPWVPHFRAPQMPIYVKGDLGPSAVSFLGPDERFLKVRGFDVGEITLVYTRLKYKKRDDDFSFGEHLRHHHKFLVEVAQETNIHLDVGVADWLTMLVVGDDSLMHKDKEIVNFRPFYDHYLQLENDDGPGAGKLQDSDDAKRFVELARKGIRNYPKLLCKGGVEATVYNIFSKLRIRPDLGDRLVALSGCESPFLLRPVLTSEGQGYAFLSFYWARDGMWRLTYNADDFSLEFYDESEFGDFILT
ncbi:HET-domain-containing protein [Diaporthe eres]|uniref:Uncharacterized protein n=1 Tax=Diaporthe vaccinii TaxID=105482 RepID=A0ABR4E5W0_9PEZI|nr:HET-domain-containing protein [Diaporthe eres]